MTQRTIPAAPLWLTLAGLIPFVACATMLIVQPDDYAVHVIAGTILIFYAALILSFLGGVRWGAELVQNAAAPRWSVLAASTIGALVGWAILIQAVLQELNRTSFLALAAMLVWQAAWDMRGTPALPAWYPRLRLIATLGAVGALLVAAFAY